MPALPGPVWWTETLNLNLVAVVDTDRIPVGICRIHHRNPHIPQALVVDPKWAKMVPPNEFRAINSTILRYLLDSNLTVFPASLGQ